MAALERAGVKVERRNTQVTTTVTDPLLKPWVVGPCFEVLDEISNGVINASAALTVPAKLVGREQIKTNLGFQDLRNKTVKLVVGNTPVQTYTLPNSLTTAAYFLRLLNANFTGVSFFWESDEYLAIQTTAKGDAASIIVKGESEFLVTCGFTLDQTATGSGVYRNRALGVAFEAFPAPRGNGGYLDFSSLESRIKAFYKQSGVLKSFYSDRTVLTSGSRAERDGASLATETDEDFDLSQSSYRLRGLSALDDSDDEAALTAMVCSPGAAATLEKVFDHPAVSTYPHSGEALEAFVFMTSKATSSKYAGEYAFEMKVTDDGEGDYPYVEISGGLGTIADPWTLMVSYKTDGSNNTLDDFVLMINEGNVLDPVTPLVKTSPTMPGTAGALTLKDVLGAVAYGDGTTVMTETVGADPVALNNIHVGSVGGVDFIATNQDYGSDGNDDIVATVVEEAGPSVVWEGNTATLSLGAAKAETTSEHAQAGHQLKVTASEYGTKWNKKINLVLAYTSAGGKDTKTFVTIANVEDETATVTITQDFDSTEVTGTTGTAMLAALLDENGPAYPFLGAAGASFTGGGLSDIMESAWDTETVQVDAGACATVTEVANAFGVAETVPDHITATVNASYAADAEYGASAFETNLSEGWDPVDFREVVHGIEGDYTYGVVVGAKDNDMATLPGKTLILGFNGGQEVTVLFQAGDDDAENAVTRINSIVGLDVAEVVDTSRVRISSKEFTVAALPNSRRGNDSTLSVRGTAIAPLLQAEITEESPDIYTGVYFGAFLAAAEGDELWDSGQLIGTILGFEDLSKEDRDEPYPNAVLLLDTRVPIAATYSGWYLKAKSLNVSEDTLYDRPLPDLVSDTTNQVLLLKGNVARGANGTPLSTTSAAFSMYVAYKALRKDLVNGVTINNVDDLDDVTPLTADNPLGLALSLMWDASSEAIKVNGIGVDEVDANEPDGTYAAYIRSKAKLMSKGKNVAATAVLTQEKSVQDAFAAMADVMTTSGNKAEQVTIISPTMPTHASSTSYGEGRTELINSQGGVQTLRFDLETLNLQSVLSDIGIEDPTDPDELMAAGIYVELESSPYHWLVKSCSVNTNSLTVWNDDTPWETTEGNEDGFYAEIPIPIPTGRTELTDEPTTILTRGVALEDDDLDGIAEAMAAQASAYNSISVRTIYPDFVEIPIDGTETRVPAYYAAAIQTVIVCKRHPAKPMANMVFPILTDAFWPDGFTDTDWAIAAGGGCNCLIPEDSVVKLRDFSTTDVSSVENREHTMVWVDFVAARIFRDRLSTDVGEHAIDDEYISYLGVKGHSISNYLVGRGIYKNCEVSDLYQSEDTPTQVVMEIARGRKYPCREILVILL